MEWTVTWNHWPSVTSWNDCLIYLTQRMGTKKQLLLPDHFLFLPGIGPPRCHLTKPLSVNNLRRWQTAEADHTLQSLDIIFWQKKQIGKQPKIELISGWAPALATPTLALLCSRPSCPVFVLGLRDLVATKKRPGISPRVAFKLDASYSMFANRTSCLLPSADQTSIATLGLFHECTLRRKRWLDRGQGSLLKSEKP